MKHVSLIQKIIALFCAHLMLVTSLGCTSPQRSEAPAKAKSALADNSVDDCDPLTYDQDLYDECMTHVSLGGPYTPTMAAADRFAPFIGIMDWDWVGNGTLAIQLNVWDDWVPVVGISGPFLARVNWVDWNTITNGYANDFSEAVALGVSLAVPGWGEIAAATVLTVELGVLIYAIHERMKAEPPAGIGRPARGLPSGVKPIDEMGWPKDRVHDVKDGIGAGSRDWVGIGKDSEVWTGSPSGDAVGHGPWGDYTNN